MSSHLVKTDPNIPFNYIFIKALLSIFRTLLLNPDVLPGQITQTNLAECGVCMQRKPIKS